MPDASSLDVFPAPDGGPIVIEHVAEEFTSLCPKTGHPDFGVVTLRYQPRPAGEGGVCVELKSLKLYYQAFRNEGIFYEDVTRRICNDLASVLTPAWLEVVTEWRGRGGIRSRIRAAVGEPPDPSMASRGGP